MQPHRLQHTRLPWPSPTPRAYSNSCPLSCLPPIRPSISPPKEIPGLISFRMDWLDLLAVQGTLKSLLQHHSSKLSILWCSAFFTVQLSHPYMTTGKTIALTRRTFVGKGIAGPVLNCFWILQPLLMKLWALGRAGWFLGLLSLFSCSLSVLDTKSVIPSLSSPNLSAWRISAHP